MHVLPSQASPVALVYRHGRKASRSRHEIETQWELARQLAKVKGVRLAGEFEDARQYPAQCYLIPDDTLSAEEARRLGVGSERDLYGGVVPFPFVATKVIVHGLPEGAHRAPLGWSHTFGQQLSALVLPGFSAFTGEDAQKAASLLWNDGAVRVKRPSGIGGIGQTVVENREQLEAALADIGDEALLAEGVVLERELQNIETLSVGRVIVDELEASYHGVQRLTVNNHGHHVYGGSDLVVVRGDFDALTHLDMSGEARTAIAQARAFDAAVQIGYAGFFASRRNYDVAWGAEASGRAYGGVLEQSWRLGGASGAEIGALKAFKTDPTVRAVRASTWEIYGPKPAVPSDACVYYHGVDPQAGEITKYYTVDGV